MKPTKLSCTILIYVNVDIRIQEIIGISSLNARVGASLNIVLLLCYVFITDFVGICQINCAVNFI